MKHPITNLEFGLIVAGVALVGVVAVSVFGSKMPHVEVTCRHAFEPRGMTAEDNTPLQKTSLFDTQVDGGVRRLIPTPGCILQDNFDIENPADLTANASSN
jgi:hypothetical protein